MLVPQCIMMDATSAHTPASVWDVSLALASPVALQTSLNQSKHRHPCQ